MAKKFFKKKDENSLVTGKKSARAARAMRKTAAYDKNGYARKDHNVMSIPTVMGAGESKTDVIRRTKAQGKKYVPMTARRRKTKKILAWAGVAFGVLLLAGVAGAFAYIYSINSTMHASVDEEVLDVLEDTASPDDPFYMLLIGCDTRDTSSSSLHGLSDTLILARVNPAKKIITLISIPRDTYVSIPGYGSTKINAAYSYGGAALAIQTVSEFANVSISHYVEINFVGLQEVVDAMGGVTIDVPESWYDPKLNYSFTAGTQTLNGKQALYFCRSRTGFADIPDFGRTEHQRLFLKTVANQLLTNTDVATMTNVVSAMAKSVSTDMSLSEILSLATAFSGFDSENNLRTAMVPSTTATMDGISYVLTIDDEWQEMLSRVANDETPTADEEEKTDAEKKKEENAKYKITVRNGIGTNGLGTECAKVLRKAGYKIESVSNADQFVYDETLVVYSGDSKKSIAEGICEDLGIGRAVEAAGKYSYDGDLLVVVGGDWGSQDDEDSGDTSESSSEE